VAAWLCAGGERLRDTAARQRAAGRRRKGEESGRRQAEEGGEGVAPRDKGATSGGGGRGKERHAGGGGAAGAGAARGRQRSGAARSSWCSGSIVSLTNTAFDLPAGEGSGRAAASVGDPRAPRRDGDVLFFARVTADSTAALSSQQRRWTWRPVAAKKRSS
jgi:hypothetical protein